MPAEDTLEGRKGIKNWNFIITKKMVRFRFAAYKMLIKTEQEFNIWLRISPLLSWNT